MRARKIASYSGQDLKDMLIAAKGWLEKSASDIDALNVFPVPDGDTGTNMLLTIGSTLEEISRSPDSRLSNIAEAIAKGSLMGARGNSGVILSQILRGVANEFRSKEIFDGRTLALALEEGARLAYKSMSQPVEGTMLTVIRDIALAARQASLSANDGLVTVLDAAVKAARESVARTPTLLPVLQQAGVVDAGGQGLYILLEGMLLFLRGEVMQQKPQIISPLVVSEQKISEAIEDVEEEKPYGYCTEFLLKGQGLSAETIKKKLENKGESLMVVGEGDIIKIHIHTYKPGHVLNFATNLGTLHGIQIHNMDDQHREYLEKQKAKNLAKGNQMLFTATTTTPVAVVAVASGDGLIKVFRSLGATEIVHGGTTMNPSIQQLLEAIEAVPSNNVIILPNNKNIIPAADQIQPLTSKKVILIPTENMPQGIAALLSFNAEAKLEFLKTAMEQARSSVKTVALTYAVRPLECCGQRIEKGQAISLVDDELVAWDNSFSEALEKSLRLLDIIKAETITIYAGDNVLPVDRTLIEALLRRHAPGAQMEIVEGGQPHYPFIISIE